MWWVAATEDNLFFVVSRSPAAAKPPRHGRVLRTNSIQGKTVVFQGLHQGQVNLTKLPSQPGIMRLQHLESPRLVLSLRLLDIVPIDQTSHVCELVFAAAWKNNLSEWSNGIQHNNQQLASIGDSERHTRGAMESELMLESRTTHARCDGKAFVTASPFHGGRA